MKKPLVSALVSMLMASMLPLTVTTAEAQNRTDRKERLEQFNKRFSDADVNGDGKLTREEAQAGMPGVAAHFDAMDVDKKGYVTKQDIARSMKKGMADRKAGN